jgi:histidinol dehydrogenase
LAKVDKVYSIGGAQSIAAFAHGTDTIPKVDIICGPGNRWVTEAKRQVYGTVGIDGLYGPTESFIIGDNSSKPEFCAVDFVSQAEHDISSVPLFCTDSEQLIQKVQNLIPNYLNIKNKSIAETVIKNNGLLILIENINDSAELVNTFAPEHVSIMTNNNDELLSLIKNVGVIFLGHYSHHVLGDYIAGPSHTMPTGGTAKFSSGVGINTFMKHVPYVNIDKQESIELSKLASIIGKAEFMDGHSNSALERIKKQAE